MMLLSKLHLAFLGIDSTSWLCTHENGLLEIFLTVCETSEAGFSGQDARRQQMSCAAAALLWPSGARFFATPRLRLNPHCQPESEPRPTHSGCDYAGSTRAAVRRA